MLTREHADFAIRQIEELIRRANETKEMPDETRLTIAAEVAALRWATIEKALMEEKRASRIITNANEEIIRIRSAAAEVKARSDEYGEAPLNEFLVSVAVGSGAIHFSPGGLGTVPEIVISADKALGLAAWLAALADPEGTKFPRIFAAVLNS